jgi:FkbM family methyltransferase
MNRLMQGAARRLRRYANRLKTFGSPRPQSKLLRRWEVWRLRSLPGVEFSVVLDPASHDPISQFIRRGMNPNEGPMELMRQIARPGDRVLDLGGHVGLFALTAAALGCEVLTVEASPGNAGLLALSARVNGFTNLHIVNCAIGAGPGLVSFCEDGPFGSIASSRVPRPVTGRVPMLSAETLLTGLGWDQLAFIKIDVEGSEIDALTGMRRFLHTGRAPAVLFESNEHTLNFFGHTTQALQGAFVAEGYRCYQVGIRRLTACSASEFQGPTCVDYLAVKGPLPELPQGWEVADGLTEAELIDQFRASLTHAMAPERASAARRLAGAVNDRVLASPLIQAALGQLHHDESAVVRDAAAWHSQRAA